VDDIRSALALSRATTCASAATSARSAVTPSSAGAAAGERAGDRRFGVFVVGRLRAVAIAQP
jgi:hypothetical protein